MFLAFSFHLHLLLPLLDVFIIRIFHRIIIKLLNDLRQLLGLVLAVKNYWFMLILGFKFTFCRPWFEGEFRREQIDPWPDDYTDNRRTAPPPFRCSSWQKSPLDDRHSQSWSAKSTVILKLRWNFVPLNSNWPFSPSGSRTGSDFPCDWRPGIGLCSGLRKVNDSRMPKKTHQKCSCTRICRKCCPFVQPLDWWSIRRCIPRSAPLSLQARRWSTQIQRCSRLPPSISSEVLGQCSYFCI